MLTAPLSVLNIRYQVVVYVNIPSHSFEYKVGHLMLKTVRGDVNINY
jgi:hypothetical protein